MILFIKEFYSQQKSMQRRHCQHSIQKLMGSVSSQQHQSLFVAQKQKAKIHYYRMQMELKQKSFYKDFDQSECIWRKDQTQTKMETILSYIQF
ncbi:unnamed protein product [Paramecium sonneborni]|uniref:Uncharacterized protein n=1 Tax=Paramecium sonneborni TaxID=65129 RepID=A0A8S1RPK7_9CILI|nr:unnamed protein product [Paramecium sonneborni]